jgi:hypothetical protein
MISCFQFCYNFSLKFNLRRYTVVLAERQAQSRRRGAPAVRVKSEEEAEEEGQGLTLVHVSTQLKRFLRDRGYI